MKKNKAQKFFEEHNLNDYKNANDNELYMSKNENNINESLESINSIIEDNCIEIEFIEDDWNLNKVENIEAKADLDNSKEKNSVENKEEVPKKPKKIDDPAMKSWTARVDAYIESQEQAKREKEKDLVVGGTVVTLNKDESCASSSNKVYKREKDEIDRYYDFVEAIFLERAKLRELGLPYDDTFESEYSHNIIAKFLSATAVASGAISSESLPTLFENIVSNSIGISEGLVVVGLLGFVGATLIAKKQDLKYRKALYHLTNVYLNSRGYFPDELVKEATNTFESNLPDKYDLACMLKEDREKLLKEAKNPNEMSKKQKIKKIYDTIDQYEASAKFRNSFVEEFIMGRN